MGGEQAVPGRQDRVAAVRGEGAGRDPRQAGQAEEQVELQRRRGGHPLAGYWIETLIDHGGH